MYLSYASYAYQIYWFLTGMNRAFYDEKHQLPSMTSKRGQMGEISYGLLVLQFDGESKKSYTKDVTRLMVDKNLKLVKNIATRLMR